MLTSYTRESCRISADGSYAKQRALAAPSTAMDCPLTNDALSESRNATTAATSVGSPRRDSG